MKMDERGRKKKQMQNRRNCMSDEELEIPPQAQVLERVKSDRMIASISDDEDRRRRTIIVEKKKGSFGFTLQSYGIHYRQEKEVEMLTYVDSVEYDGPAYRAGMREGDVILSINGIDMEDANHKTLVNFIKGCESRMRMVVLFENCVRKVELHMKYIQLQEILQYKIDELDRVCVKEKELLAGKWKTHSLPARKKISNNNENCNDDQISPEGEKNVLSQARPISSENVANLKQQNQIIPPPAEYIHAYQYINPSQRYLMKSETPCTSGEYLASASTSSQRLDSQTTQSSFVSLNSMHHQAQQQQSPKRAHHHHHHHHHPHETKPPEIPEKSRSHVSQSCNTCIGNFIARRYLKNDKDNTSLDAYDLASTPCCETNICVPVKRRSKHHHKHKHRDSSKSREKVQRPKSQSHATVHKYQQTDCEAQYDIPTNAHSYCNLSSQLANQCSINNCSYNTCNSQTFDNNEKYSNSLGNDKMYDNDQAHAMNCQRPNPVHYQQMDQATSCIGRYVNTGQIHPQVHPVQNFVTTHAYTQQAQPGVLMHQKSWDNIPAAKAAAMAAAHSSKVTHHIYPPTLPPKHSSGGYERYVNFDVNNCSNVMPHQFVKEATYTKTTIITTKSTDNLMGNAGAVHYGNHGNMIDNCKCIVQTKQIISPNCIACNNPGYYSNIKKSSSSSKRYVPTKTEITRL